MSKIVASAFLIFAFLSPCFGDDKAKPNKINDVEKYFIPLRHDEDPGIDFPRLGWKDIPTLLELSVSTVPLKQFPRNCLSSQLETECTEGMVALWIIEGIRKGVDYPSLNALCFKKGVDKKDWTKASEDNHEAVKKAYEKWWDKVKDMKPKKAAKVDPLEGTELSWH